MNPTRRRCAAVAGAATVVALATAAGPVTSGAAAASAPHAAHHLSTTMAGGHQRVDPRRVTPLRAHDHGNGGASVANDQSENWSGYIQSGSGINRSYADWTVPTLSTTYDGYSSSWVGVDGASAGDQYLIQTGTEADVVNGTPHYDAWWEVITPTDVAPETQYANLPVRPGDSISARVAKGSGGTWTMTLVDRTTGKSGSHTSAFAGPGRSAEWIQEDTDVNGYISAAPDWHSVTFSGVTVNGVAAHLASDEPVDIVDSHGTQEDHTGAPSANAFRVTWLAHGTRTYVGG